MLETIDRCSGDEDVSILCEAAHSVVSCSVAHCIFRGSSCIAVAVQNRGFGARCVCFA